MKRFLKVLLLLVALSTPSLAAIKLPRLISDGMVLQRDSKLKIWGWAKANEKISIHFKKKTYRSISNKNGEWEIILPAQKAGGSYKMEIQGENKITINNILIGDVWLCAGQSNMVLPMERVKEKYHSEIDSANYPSIRNFFIPTSASISKISSDLSGGQWQVTDPKSVLGFGAVSYFFAKRIFTEYHIPIGIINASVGGTPIQAWISENGLKEVPVYSDRVQKLKDSTFIYNLKHPANPVIEPIINENTDAGLNPKLPWYSDDYTPKNWQKFWLPGYWADQGIKNLNGIVWFRKDFFIADSITLQEAKLFVGRIVDADEVFINGKRVGSTSYQYPPRRYTVKEGVLRKGKNSITVRVINYGGKGGFVPDKPYYLDLGKMRIDLTGEWKYKVGQVFAARVGQEKFSEQNEPTSLYNTMIAPLRSYAIKGILWYQGESNSSQASTYHTLMKALIADWRSHRNNTALPFIFAQLPNYMEVSYSPSNSNWAELREAQLQTLAVPQTGMSVTIDVGEWNDIHPLDKKTVGERLALLARSLAYKENIVASGPIFESFKIKENSIELSFTNIGSGLSTTDGGPLTQFAIAGEDKKFVWAKAVINGDIIVVSHTDVPHPRHVRYAWADNPLGANLQNKDGLLASPFRTDINIK
ncbi:MAG: sialate O-acetylesterase [Pedobacter sp.]|nr:MAG: sialate O-acetylesterase [Pedobacter sp.]